MSELSVVFDAVNTDHQKGECYRGSSFIPSQATNERLAKSRLTEKRMLSMRRLCHVLLQRVHQPNQEVSTSIWPKIAHAELHFVHVLGSFRA